MSHFNVGSFNLYNLVLPGHTYYNNKVYSEGVYHNKINWIRSQINHMGAQVVGFQEVFHKRALVEALDETDFRPDHVVVLNDSGESPVVGLASLFPLVDEPVSISDLPAAVMDAMPGLSGEYAKFSRPVLKAKLALSDNLVVTVFVSHLKSKRPTILQHEDESDFIIKAVGQTRSLLKRAVEATGLRALVLEEMTGNNNPVIVIGDLNDSTRAVTSEVIAGPTPWKYAPIEERKKYWDVALYSTFDIITRKSFKKEWATHIYEGHYEALDHIYVSQEFYFRNKNRIGNVEFVHIHDDHLKDNTLSPDNIPKWQSDHGQVVATISLDKKDKG